MPKISKVKAIKATPQPIEGQPSGLKACKKGPFLKVFKKAVVIALAIILGATTGGFAWYKTQLQSVGNDTKEFKVVTIASGSTPDQISDELKKQSVIRSSTAFDIYARLAGKSNLLRAGIYRLSPSETTAQILNHLVNGSSLDTFNITFYPGATLADNIKVLEKAGYSNQEITKALNTASTNPLFDNKPANTDLEGYIYGDTYNFNTGATVNEILERTFDEFYKVIQDNNLVEKFASHSLSLYQGITLASIVQREVNTPLVKSEPSQDQRQVAQVFYTRLNSGMALGSDVTYQYISDKLGVARDVNIDSPYNTRRYVGLPPGPISVPSLTALKALAEPASGDYVYFLSGDDDVVYFAHTNAEHEANITSHCKIKCSTL